MTHELHPLCTLFPRMSDAEFTALRGDIRTHGQREPIMLLDGKVLDGGNRYRACIEEGIEPFCENFPAGSDPVAYVLSVNLHRRHLSPGQQAAIVASAQDWATAQPAGRPEKSGNVAGLSTVAKRAAESGASERTQRMADSVAKADPALARQVGRGEVSLPAAVAKVSGKAPAKPKPKEKPEVPANNPATLPDNCGASDGPSLPELVDELQRENEGLQAAIKALEAQDGKAELGKYIRLYEQAKRTADEKQEAAHRFQSELQRTADRLTRIGKLFNERDPAKIPALVEGFVRKHTGVTA